MTTPCGEKYIKTGRWFTTCECFNCHQIKEVRLDTLKYSKSDKYYCSQCHGQKMARDKSGIGDLSGKKYGNLTVLKYIGSKKKWGKVCPFYECLCDCGRLIEHSSTFLIGVRKTKDCGCKKKSMQIRYSVNVVYNTYRSNASKRGLLFNLEIGEFYKLICQDCHYCGASPSNKSISGHKNRSILYNGIDRVENNLGYVGGNIVPCCKTCNRAKLNFGENEFLNWVQRVYFHSVKANVVTLISHSFGHIPKYMSA